MELAECYSSFGFLYLENKIDKSIEYFEKALAVHNELRKPDHPDLANIFNNLGGAWKEKARRDKCIENFEKALKYFNQAKVIASAWDDRIVLKQIISDNVKGTS